MNRRGGTKRVRPFLDFTGSIAAFCMGGENMGRKRMGIFMLLLLLGASGCGQKEEAHLSEAEEEKTAQEHPAGWKKRIDREGTESGVKAEDKGVYLCKDSDKQMLEDTELTAPSVYRKDFLEDKVDGYNPNWYNLAVNEIHARHGYAFQTESIRQYFEAQPWYEASTEPEDFQESNLNDFEKENIQKLLKGKETHKRDEISAEGNTYTITSNTTYEPVFRDYTFTFQVPQEWLAEGYSITACDTSSDSTYWVIAKDWKKEAAILNIIPMEHFEGNLSGQEILWKDHVCMLSVDADSADEKLTAGIEKIKETINRVQR